MAGNKRYDSIDGVRDFLTGSALLNPKAQMSRDDQRQRKKRHGPAHGPAHLKEEEWERGERYRDVERDVERDIERESAVPHTHIHQKVARVAGGRRRGNWECGLGGGRGPRGLGARWGRGREEKGDGRVTDREREREREKERERTCRWIPRLPTSVCGHRRRCECV